MHIHLEIMEGQSQIFLLMHQYKDYDSGADNIGDNRCDCHTGHIQPEYDHQHQI